jgi:hypothetical protein
MLDKKASASLIKSFSDQIKVLQPFAEYSKYGVANNYAALAIAQLKTMIKQIKNFDEKFVNHPAIKAQAKR